MDQNAYIALARHFRAIADILDPSSSSTNLQSPTFTPPSLPPVVQPQPGAKTFAEQIDLEIPF